MTNRPTIGFIGLGLMGARMAARLVDDGLTVHVWNRTSSKAEPLARKGAIVEPTPAAVADAAEIVCLCLADTETVEAVIFGADGVREGALPHKLLVDFSSIKPGATRDFAARLQNEGGMGWIDAPVSGGIKGAEAGRLAIMAGGEEKDVDFIREPLSCLYHHLTHMGPVGSGQIAKLCNQMIVATCLSVVAEVTNLAGRAGIEAAKLPEAFAGGWADSEPMRLYLPRMSRRQMEPKTGSAATLIKDARAALELARELNIETPMTAAAADIMARCVEAGFGDEDISALIKIYEPDA